MNDQFVIGFKWKVIFLKSSNAMRITRHHFLMAKTVLEMSFYFELFLIRLVGIVFISILM